MTAIQTPSASCLIHVRTLSKGRPASSDPGDDAILEAAIAGRCDYVVSFNERHLRVIREFGIEVLKPVDLLKLIGEIK
jgi:predicted nucleic acid-binding protein